MGSKHSFRTSVNGPNATVYNADTVHVRASKTRRSPTSYPSGCIGADLIKRNYVRYLVERFNRFKQADTSFGKASGRFSYAIIFKNIEARFRAPTYFIPIVRFDELVDYLHSRVDQTILGKRNLARGQRNYETFDEYQLSQSVVSTESVGQL
jgi:hypothetical protein